MKYDIPVVISVKATDEEHSERIVKSFLDVASKDINIGEIIDWQFNTDFIDYQTHTEECSDSGCRNNDKKQRTSFYSWE
jgi:hypothetical protein